MTEYANFRQRLDAALRTLNVEQVRDFLIAENQWDEGAPSDPEFAMWMMIAGSSTLPALHEQARQWLVSHGHEDEANAISRREKGTGGSHTKRNQQQHTGKPKRYLKQNGDTRQGQLSDRPKKDVGSVKKSNRRPS
jgi:hypothetical protein